MTIKLSSEYWGMPCLNPIISFVTTTIANNHTLLTVWPWVSTLRRTHAMIVICFLVGIYLLKVNNRNSLWNLFKVNNKQHQSDVCSSLFIVDFEQVHATWVSEYCDLRREEIKKRQRRYYHPVWQEINGIIMPPFL